MTMKEIDGSKIRKVIYDMSYLIDIHPDKKVVNTIESALGRLEAEDIHGAATIMFTIQNEMEEGNKIRNIIDQLQNLRPAK